MLRVKKKYFNEETLKKFGYEKSNIIEDYYTHTSKSVYVSLSKEKIRIYSHTNDGMDVLYDLISAGLVEKVPYERRKKKTKEQQRIDKAIEELKTLSNLYDDNYTISDKAKDIIEILKGE